MDLWRGSLGEVQLVRLEVLIPYCLIQLCVDA
jgi:hypothetical protein